jgi:hypothetical protein
MDEDRYDDCCVLVEAASQSSDFDDYVGYRPPEDVRSMLYDRLDRKVIDSDTRDIGPVWNR